MASPVAVSASGREIWQRSRFADIVALRLVAEGPDRHVRDQAAAKIADRLSLIEGSLS